MPNEQNAVIRIVDDDPGIHDAVSLVLTMAGYSIRHYYSAEEFLTADLLDTPGCAIVDIRMGGMSGLELQDQLHVRGKTIPLIFLSGHGTIDTAVDTLQKGAVTFLTKPVRAKKLLEGIQNALNKTNPRELALPPFSERIGSLSAREKDILRMVKKGLSSRMIGEYYNISSRTVEFHRAGAMKKLYCRNASELKTLLEKVEL